MQVLAIAAFLSLTSQTYPVTSLVHRISLQGTANQLWGGSKNLHSSSSYCPGSQEIKHHAGNADGPDLEKGPNSKVLFEKTRLGPFTAVLLLCSVIRHLELGEQRVTSRRWDLAPGCERTIHSRCSFADSLQPEQSSHRTGDSWREREKGAQVSTERWHQNCQTLPQSLGNVTGDPLGFVPCGSQAAVIPVQCHPRASSWETGCERGLSSRSLLETREEVISFSFFFF